MPKKIEIHPCTQREIILNLTSLLRENYVFPEIAEKICLCLQQHLDAGDYAQITAGDELAAALTLHLREANQDEHLRVTCYPEPLPAHEGSLGGNQEWLDEWFQKARLDNFGLHKVERLPGNVGYVDIREFYSPDWAGDTAAAAMNYVANSNALIIDLRQCRGGDPGMVAMIATYLFSESVHLNDFFWRKGNLTEQSWTLPYVPGKRFVDKPVYLLTSKATFSGAEEFAYDLKTRQRATLVGESTGGGAHPGAPHRLHDHFDVFIPMGRPINPITGTNWEGCGVTPDVAASQEDALRVAYGMALRFVIENLAEKTSAPFLALRKEAQAALQALEQAE